MRREPQLTLRLDVAASVTDAHWRAGAGIVHLGDRLTLVLDTASPVPAHVGSELHLPLPPAATSRQIRDAAESWLREEALRIFSGIAQKKSALAGRRPPQVVLSFGKRGDWVQPDGDLLRCHWRLVEQPLPVIEQGLAHALVAPDRAPACDDLFALA